MAKVEKFVSIACLLWVTYRDLPFVNIEDRNTVHDEVWAREESQWSISHRFKIAGEIQPKEIII